MARKKVSAVHVGKKKHHRKGKGRKGHGKKSMIKA